MFHNRFSLTFQTNYDGSLIIGSKWDGNDKFYGYIGDVRVYNKELSATEISDIYNGSQVNYSGVSYSTVRSIPLVLTGTTTVVTERRRSG